MLRLQIMALGRATMEKFDCVEEGSLTCPNYGVEFGVTDVKHAQKVVFARRVYAQVVRAARLFFRSSHYLLIRTCCES